MTQVQKVGANPMAATWTKAGKVRRAFKTGRQIQKNRVLTPTVAIYEACILLDEIRHAMSEAHLSPDDVQAALVLVTPETPDRKNWVYVLVVPPPEKLPELFANVEEIERPGKVWPLGILLRQVDREAQKEDKVPVAVWPRPFLTGDRATRALKKAGELFLTGSGGKNSFD